MIGGYGMVGYGSYIKRTFSNLNSHTKLRITGKYHILDNWDLHQSESLIIWVDGSPVFRRVFDNADNYGLPSICGYGGDLYGDLIN